MARIIRARRAPFIGGGRGARRKTEWVARVFDTVFNTLAANTVVLDSVSGAASLAQRPFTIVRTVGVLTVQSDQAAATEFPFGGFGMCVVSDQAVAAGVGSVPDPVTEASSDLWFVYQAWAAPLQQGSNTAFADISHEYLFESRAMRKVEEGQTVIAVLANSSASFGMKYILNYRFLVKLH